MKKNITRFVATKAEPKAATKAAAKSAQDPAPMFPGVVVDFFDGRGPEPARIAADPQKQAADSLAAAEIWEALSEQRTCMHYQPQYDPHTGLVLAAEALVRLLDADGELIYPGRFIKTADHGDLIVVLGRAVIERVCADLASCRRKGLVLQSMAVNVSAHQLRVDKQLPDFVDEVLDRHGLDYSDLEFELKERQQMADGSCVEAVLGTFADRGSRIVLDDFGMGFSSIAYLMTGDLPVSVIKLDRELVEGLPDDPRRQRLIEHLMSMAASLGLEVVAEGVETAAQNKYLMDVGCRCAQGFGFAKPMNIIDLQQFVTADGGRNSVVFAL